MISPNQPHPKVCVQGLGFVGAAMATAVATARSLNEEPLFEVIGIDLPSSSGQARIDAINSGRFPFRTIDRDLQKATWEAFERGNLRATSEPSEFANASIVIVDVDLSIRFTDENPSLQLENFQKAIQTIGQFISEDTLVLIESTVPPGTCEKIVLPILQEKFLGRGFNPAEVLLAHSYERVMPGPDYLRSLTHMWRVFAATSEPASARCREFLSSVVHTDEFPLTELSTTTASETAKVLENTYRAINIAFIDEWSGFAEKAGIDLFEVIGAIQQRPTHRNIRYPGLGIGGYCLTKDPAFAPAAARELFGVNCSFPFVSQYLATAQSMPLHAVNRFLELLDDQIQQPKVLLCGLAYRPGVSDTRYSPSETVYDYLIQKGADVSVHDPLVEYWKEENLSVPAKLPDPRNFDGIFFAVPHQEYKTLDLENFLQGSAATPLIFDAFMVWDSDTRKKFRRRGVRIEAVGVATGK